MPKREGEARHLHLLDLEERRQQEGRFQEHWYRHAAEFCRGKTVLDVGAGSGYGMDIVAKAGADGVHGIDLLPLRSDISTTPLIAFSRKRYDVVLAIDVIEHVADDREFLVHLLRVAREAVFLSTPNWDVTRCANPFHVREYTPEEFRSLLAPYKCEFWSSDALRAISTGMDGTNFGALVRP